MYSCADFPRTLALRPMARMVSGGNPNSCNAVRVLITLLGSYRSVGRGTLSSRGRFTLFARGLDDQDHERIRLGRGPALLVGGEFCGGKIGRVGFGIDAHRSCALGGG